MQGSTQSVDIRFFVTAVTTLMVAAFSIGISMPGPIADVTMVAVPKEASHGPHESVNPALENKEQIKASSPVGMSFQQNESNGFWVAVDNGEALRAGNVPSSSSISEKKDSVAKYQSRFPTQHVADLGELVESIPVVDEHQPSGQHLLVDLKNVEAAFLDSEERLAQAMVDVVREAHLTLLSYHCHSLQPAGVSCVGVLLESHISFHTWPDEGVITLDLFTCGPNPLMPVIPSIEKLFGVPRSEDEEVVSKWGHELRGFRYSSDRRKHYLDNASDLASWVIAPMNLLYKKEIVSVVTPYQRIDIWDTKEPGETPSHDDVLKYNLQKGDPRLLTSELTSPSRIFFLDGTAQSVSDFEKEFHEALVHPAMFAHDGPRRVAIIGGGEGATLREVLKHNTVEHVKMIEIDEMVVQVAKEYLPTFNNCSSFVGLPESCFDDPRADILYADAMKYFIEEGKDESFDIVVIDGLDPEDAVGQPKDIYLNDEFFSSVFESLTDEGIVVAQVGTAPTIHDPAAHRGVFKNREKLFNLFEAHAAAMFVYEDPHCGFQEPHSFVIACKSTSCRKRWYARSNAIDYQIYERIVETKNDNLALVHYDGATHSQFQYAPKAWETIYCRREPMPYECNFRGLDLREEIFEFDVDPEKSSFSIEKKENGQVGVFAKVFIKKGSYILAEELASSFVISDTTVESLQNSTKVMSGSAATVIEDMLAFVGKNGHASMIKGVEENIVEIGASYLIRKVESLEEANTGRMMPFPKNDLPPYSPVYERHRRSFDVFLVATKDINPGEELLKFIHVWEQ